MPKIRTATLVCFLVTVLLIPLSAEFAAAQAPAVQPQYQPEFFTFQEVMIPMRDGVRLQTVILTPKQASGPLPILMQRTPYGVPASASAIPASAVYDEPLFADGYVFVWQNIRGRFKSEGTFVMQRPPRDKNDPKSIDEGTDAYDTIDWLIKNVPNNNGKVGMRGTSYPGWLVTQALLEPHPALKAVSEQASPDDMFINDDFHHNGAFRLSYGFEYAALLETSKEKNTNFEFDRYDTYSWYLSLGALSNANARYFHGKLPTWNDFVQHPNHDFWKQHAVTTYLKHTTVPNLNVAGWYDQEDFVGPTAHLRRAGANRYRAPQLLCRRSLEPRRMVGRDRPQARETSTGAATRRVISAHTSWRRGSRIGCTTRAAGSTGSRHFPNRHQRLAEL